MLIEQGEPAAAFKYTEAILAGLKGMKGEAFNTYFVSQLQARALRCEAACACLHWRLLPAPCRLCACFSVPHRARAKSDVSMPPLPFALPRSAPLPRCRAGDAAPTGRPPQ